MTAIKKLHVAKGDNVLILSGKDKKKTGKVIASFPNKGKVIVEDINKVKRHTKPSQSNSQGGIIVKEAPISSSNVMLICPLCDKATRIKNIIMKNAKKERICKKCDQIIEKKVK